MNKLINEIFGDAQVLSKSGFVDKLCEPNMEALLVPSGLRYFLFKIYESSNAAAFDKNVNKILKNMMDDVQ